jgi:hypothetical protein
MSNISRIEKSELIKNGIKYLEDSDINQIFEILKCDIDIDDSICENKKRHTLIILIIDNIYFVDDDNLMRIFQIVVDKLKSQGTKKDERDALNIGEAMIKTLESRKKKKKEIIMIEMEKDEKKAVKEEEEVVKEDVEGGKEGGKEEVRMKEIMLEIINKLLKLMNKNEINDLCQFTDINRDELIKDKYANLINEQKDYIFNCTGFNKYICQVYQKKVTNVHISILKGMLKQIGYELISKNHKKMIKGVYNTYTSYSIHVRQ